MLEEEKTKALVVCDNAIEDLLIYNLETSFNFNVVAVRTWEEANPLFESESYSLVVCSIKDSLSAEAEATNLYRRLQKRCAVILLGNYSAAEGTLLDQYNHIQTPHIADKDLQKAAEAEAEQAFEQEVPRFPLNKAIVMINLFITKKFTLSSDESVLSEEFSPIPIKTLMRFRILQFPAYLKLKTRYLKVLSIGDVFFSSDFQKYQSKGLDRLYVLKSVAKWTLKVIDEKMESIVANPEAQLELPPMPSLDVSKKSKASASEEEDFFPDQMIQDGIGKPFTLTESDKIEIQRNLSSVVQNVKRNPEIDKLLKILKVNRKRSDYYVSHIACLINVATAISNHMDWTSDKTIEKLVYACYFHDVGLAERPELANIQTEAEAIKRGLSAEEIKLVLSHPLRVAELLKNIDGFPDDVHVIVEQHHEHPSGSGFPKKITSARITPMTALFIVAHEFVDYIIEHENWLLVDFLALKKPSLTGNNFRKVIQSLEKVKS
ncbi:MAG: hypothetical protein HQK50_14715 [Oligoflexia bacterium]|nr:hypothetical protein [Oligoflexia bacterium]MBF0366823.1 hypothetical protein [Oligoflexia bacterium]